jgi:galactonate dehydratase
MKTENGLSGYGECGRLTRETIDEARKRVIGVPVTSYAQMDFNPGVQMAMLDLASRAADAPLYRFLGGATRHKVRALTTADAETANSAGFRALQIPLAKPPAFNQGDAFAKAVVTRAEAARRAGFEVVLGGGGALSPADAAVVAADLERFHLLWFDEPCGLSNLSTIRKIAEETVTPLGFGRDVPSAATFQDLLRDGLIDVVRPDLARESLVAIRRIAALAETYYVAVAPNHEGGPVATAAALHLAGSLPNFFIQHIPLPAAQADRDMRAALVREPVERVREGFAALPGGLGLGITVNESALEKYKDAAA